MINDIEDWAEWLRHIPAAMAAIVRLLIEAPRALAGDERTRWTRLSQKLDNIAQALTIAQIEGSGDRSVWNMNLAVAMLTFPTQTDDQLLKTSLGIQWSTPENQGQIEDWRTFAKEWVDQQTALNTGVRHSCGM